MFDLVSSANQQVNNVHNFFELFGKAAIVIISLLVLNIIVPVIWLFIVRPSLPWRSKLKATNGSWAIITGCTDGIGLAFAKKLADKGFNLCLISRSQSKLEDLKKNLLSRYCLCGKVEILAFDFSSTDYKIVEEKIKSLPRVNLLINNVGIVPGTFDPPVDYFTQTGRDIVFKALKVNILSCTRMTNIVLPIMESQKSGTILNLSSIFGTRSSPLFSVYGATKTFVDFFGRALKLECSSKGIRVQTLTPCLVQTSMAKMETNITVPKADEFVESVFRTFAIDTRTTGFWSHQVMYRSGALLSVLSPFEYWQDRATLSRVADEMDELKRELNIPFEPHAFQTDIFSFLIDKFGLLVRSATDKDSPIQK